MEGDPTSLPALDQAPREWGAVEENKLDTKRVLPSLPPQGHPDKPCPACATARGGQKQQRLPLQGENQTVFLSLTTPPAVWVLAK